MSPAERKQLAAALLQLEVLEAQQVAIGMQMETLKQSLTALGKAGTVDGLIAAKTAEPTPESIGGSRKVWRPRHTGGCGCDLCTPPELEQEPGPAPE